MKKPIFTGAVFVTALAPIAAIAAIEEVIVSAQRREQNIQEVPISVTAFSGEALASQNIRSATDFLSLTPNVSFTHDGQSGARGLGIAIRGINNLVTGENAFINSNGIYLDEFSIASVPNQVANPQIPDMRSIEILRGPQGTYFGRNSLGGALNMSTNDPTDKFEGQVIVGGESYEDAGEMWNVTLVANAPIAPNFKARGVFFYEDSSGLVENVTDNARDDSGHEYINARVKAQWDVTEDTTIKTTIIYSDEDQGHDENVPTGVWDIDTVDTFGLGNPGGLVSPINPGTGFFPDNQNKLSHDLNEFNKGETLIAIFNFRHQWTDDIAIKFVGGVIDAEQKRFFDNDTVGDLDLIKRNNRYEGLSWSTELRFEMTKDSYDLVGGILYAQDDQEQFNKVAISTNPTAAYVGPECEDAGGCGFLPPFPEDLGLALNEKNFEVKQVAVFADWTWHFAEAWDLILGGRYTHDKVENEIVSNGIRPGPGAPSPAVDPFGFFQSFINFERPRAAGSEKFDDFSPRMGLRFQVTETSNVYLTVSKGYKAGGTAVGNNTNNNNVAFTVPFESEQLWNYELGLKSDLLDNTLRLSASVFHLEWSDLQLEAFRFLTPGDLSSNFEQVVSVKDADATGFETEFLWAATDQLTISGAFGYLDTEITSPTTAQLTGGINVNLQGLNIPKAPEITANLNGEYRFPLAGNEAWIRIEYVHRDGQFSDVEALTFRQHRGMPTQGGGLIPLTGSFPYRTPDYDIVNLRVGYDMDPFRISFFVQNLGDEDYYTGTQENFGISGIRVRPNPRFFGGNVSYRWE